MSTPVVPVTAIVVVLVPLPIRPVPTTPNVAILPPTPTVPTVIISLLAVVPPKLVPKIVIVSPATYPVPALAESRVVVYTPFVFVTLNFACAPAPPVAPPTNAYVALIGVSPIVIIVAIYFLI